MLVPVRLGYLLHALVERLHVAPKVHEGSKYKLHVLSQLIVDGAYHLAVAWRMRERARARAREGDRGEGKRERGREYMREKEIAVF